MRYTRNIPTEDQEYSNELLAQGWKRLKEPADPGAAVLAAFPLSLLLILLEGLYCICLYTPLYRIFIGESELAIEFSIGFQTLLPLAAIPCFLMVHEMIHAVFIPNFLHSDSTCWGMNGLFGFVFTGERLSKERFLLISVMPLLALSVVLPLILSITGLLNGYMVFLCILNAGGSCVDLLNMILIAKQVPRHGLIQNSGMATFYRS